MRLNTSALGWLLPSGGWDLVRNCCDPAAALPHVRFEPMLTDAAVRMKVRIRSYLHP